MTDFSANDNVSGSLLTSPASGVDNSGSFSIMLDEIAYVGNLPTTAAIVTVTSITYFKRGWYATNRVFEYWLTTNPDAGPPSGHVLIDITIIDRPYVSS